MSNAERCPRCGRLRDRNKVIFLNRNKKAIKKAIKRGGGGLRCGCLPCGKPKYINGL